jgi:hypothetical protein
VFKPLSLVLFAALAGCATTYRAQPVEVTRYHLGGLNERTSISVEPIAPSDVGFGYKLYADAVGAELARMGFVPSAPGSPSGYIAAVGFRRMSAGSFKEAPPVTIGLGGGSFSGGRRGGVGVGGDVGFGIGGKMREAYVSELWVQLRRRSDNTTLWEGKAQTRSVGGTAADNDQTQAERMAKALFKGFPGESGITTTVK